MAKKHGLKAMTGLGEKEDGLVENCLIYSCCLGCCATAQEVTEVGKFFPAEK
jgi:hypothetical protein